MQANGLRVNHPFICHRHKGIDVNSSMPKLRLSGLILTLALFTHAAESAVLIDNFSDLQCMVNGGSCPNLVTPATVSVTGTDLGNPQRTLAATPFPSGTSRIMTEDGLLTVGNSSDSNGTASILYSFNSIDLTAFASALLLTTESSDAPYAIEMLANGTSSLSIQNLPSLALGAVTQTISFNFSQFSDPTAFKQLHSLKLTLRGAKNAWDADFSNLTTDTHTVPEPSVTALLIIGAFGIAGAGRRKTCTV